MTVVEGSVEHIGLEPLSGVLAARTAQFRSSGDVLLAPESVPFPIVDGVVSADLSPGPAQLTVQVGSHARERFDVVIPDEGPVTLATLVDESFDWTPDQIREFVRLRDETVAAADRAEAAAEDVDAAIAGAADEVVAAVEADRVAAETAASEAASSASGASSSASDAAGSASDAAGSATAAASSASDAAGSASDAAGSATGASQSAATASTAAGQAQDAREGAESAAQVITDNLGAIEAAPGAASDAASSASDAAGSATAAAGSASAAAQSESAASSSAVAAAGSEQNASQHEQAAESHAADALQSRDDSRAARSDAVEAASDAQGHASDASHDADRAGDERIAAQDSKVRADEHADRSRDEADRSEAAADVAESYRWIVRGEWSAGEYVAGDVVVHEERAWRTPETTTAEPPASPWVPLTPSPGEGINHWDELDGKPSEFPPEAHTHDAGDVSGEATPLLDVSEASVGDASVAEALDGKSDSGHTHSISNVDGLEGTLDALEAGKADTGHTHTKGEVGLGNVDNTADADKPVSSDQRSAIDARPAMWLWDGQGSWTAPAAANDGDSVLNLDSGEIHSITEA